MGSWTKTEAEGNRRSAAARGERCPHPFDFTPLSLLNYHLITHNSIP